MSDMVHVSRGEGDELNVSVGNASILINELRVRPRSNFVTPHTVLGKGGANIDLTSKQLLNLVAEYLRWSLDTVDVRHVEHQQSQVGFSFHCKKDGTSPNN